MTVAKAAINQKTALALLRRARDEKGSDYVDPNSSLTNSSKCAYFRRSGAAGCIVGHVLDYAGVRPFTPRSRYNKISILGLTAKYDNLFTAGAVRVLQAAQDVQDLQGSWGLAVSAATALAH